MFDLIVGSDGYKKTVGEADKAKVAKAIAGLPSVKPSARLAQAAWYLARRLSPVTPPPPPPPPPPPAPRLAPQTYNKGSRSQDARYCINAPGVSRVGDDRWQDEGGYIYNSDGFCFGGRSGNPVAGLKPADMMDGRQPCDPYTNDGQSFPPWPAASYEV